MKAIIMMVAGLSVIANSNATQIEKSEKLADAKAAIVLINHIGWEVSRIKTMADKPSLEAEYEMISLDQLNLATIKDKETVDQIRALGTYVTNKRIEVGEREMLQRELDYNLDNAFYDAFPSPSAILVADWRLIAYNLVQSTLSGYMRYKKAVAQLKIGHERNLWELEKGMVRALDELYQNLFAAQQELVQEYKLDDYWRVSPSQAQELAYQIERAISDNRDKELFDFLNHPFQRRTYQKLPIFWYYLGVAAEKVGKKDVALGAYDSYQNEFCQILRFDRTAASVAMNKAVLMLENSAPEKQVRDQLRIIEKNMSNDWTFMYFCASVYFNKLKDVGAATKAIDQAISILGNKFNNSMQSTMILCEGNELSVSDHTIPSAMPLVSCCSLRLQIEGKTISKDSVRQMLDETQRKWGRNCFGMLSYYGQIPFAEIENYIRPCFSGIHLEYQYDGSLFNNPVPYRFFLNLPIDWFFAGELVVSATATFDDGSNPMEIGLHPRYDGKNPRIVSGGQVQYILDCPSEIVRHSSPRCIEILLKNKFFPLVLVFDAKGLKNARGADKNAAELRMIKAKYKSKVIEVCQPQ